MADSRKLTDNELEQVAGGNGTPGVSFSVGDYVKPAPFGSEIVYRIDTLNGFNATATKYGKKPDDSVTITSNQNIDLTRMTKLDSKPDWVPVN